MKIQSCSISVNVLPKTTGVSWQWWSKFPIFKMNFSWIYQTCITFFKKRHLQLIMQSISITDSKAVSGILYLCLNICARFFELSILIPISYKHFSKSLYTLMLCERSCETEKIMIPHNIQWITESKLGKILK